MVVLGLLDVFLGFFGVIERSARIGVDLDYICPLVVHLSVDIFDDAVDFCHEAFNVVEVLLPLLDYIVHVGRLALNLELLQVDRFVHQLLLAIVVVETPHAALAVVHGGLAAAGQVEVLLELDLDLLHLLLELVGDFGQASFVGLLLLLLLALRPVRHTDRTVVSDHPVQFFRLFFHRFLLVFDVTSELAADLVGVAADLVFL